MRKRKLYEVEIYGKVERMNGERVDVCATARGRTLDSAIVNAGKRAGIYTYAGVGNLQHFPGGSTYHVQFGRYIPKAHATTLGNTYVVHLLNQPEA